ncbi:MAG: hypothetical protein JWP88_361 [Flaviaesturariibacter sp.]|nr:hypothetical protein [Flaviaesturariibacter sp.]
MTDPFELPVTYKGKEIHFPAQLLPFGYTYQLKVEVEGQDVLFDRDEEGTFRASLESIGGGRSKAIDPALLQAIADAIDRISE